MAEYLGTIVTKKGRDLLGKVQAGTALVFTKVVYGSGILPDGQDYRDVTNMIAPKLTLPTRSATSMGDGVCKVEAILSNIGLAEGFFASEMGVYATDPQLGEILYAYDYAGNKADYIAADVAGGINPLNVPVDIYFAIGNASSVTITITAGTYALQEDLLSHIQATTDPHPNWIKKLGAITSPTHVWGQSAGDEQLHPVAMDALKTIVLGGDGSDITNMRSQIDQIGREQANMALALEAQNIYPDYNALLAEDFTNPDLVDQFSCAITSIVAGDDSIDVETLRGIVPGAWYTISDGVYQETCQVKSAVKNGSTYRLIMQSAIVNTYVSGQTYLYRSTAEIQTSAGQAEGAGDRRTALWQPTTTWVGVTANATINLPLATTTDNLAAFAISGDVALTADGFASLQ